MSVATFAKVRARIVLGAVLLVLLEVVNPTLMRAGLGWVGWGFSELQRPP